VNDRFLLFFSVILWATSVEAAVDLTPSRFIDLRLGTESSFALPQAVVGNRLLFLGVAADGGYEIWSTPGDSATLLQITDFDAGLLGSSINHIVSDHDRVYYRATDPVYGRELFTSVVDLPGADLVVDLNPSGNSVFSGGTALANNHVFIISDEYTQAHPNYAPFWAYDIQTGQTDFLSGDTLIEISELTSVGNGVFFTGDRALPYDEGPELYFNDGTPGEIDLVHDFNPGQFGSLPQELTPTDQGLYLRAGTATSGGNPTDFALWKVDPVTLDALRLTSNSIRNPSQLTPIDSELYFIAEDQFGTGVLYRVDQLTNDLDYISDIPTGVNSLSAVGNELSLFVSISPGGTRLLWSDGQVGNPTQFVMDFQIDGLRIRVGETTAIDSLLFFTLIFEQDVDGGPEEFLYQELWVSDGTPEGTVSVMSDLGNEARISGLLEFDGNLFFQAPSALDTDGLATDYELWYLQVPEPSTFVLIGPVLFFVYWRRHRISVV